MKNKKVFTGAQLCIHVPLSKIFVTASETEELFCALLHVPFKSFEQREGIFGADRRWFRASWDRQDGGSVVRARCSLPGLGL